MLPIKKVLDLNTELSLSLPNFHLAVAEAIVSSLPYYNNDINNVFLTFRKNVGIKMSGEVMSFEYFKKNYSQKDEVLTLIKNQQSSPHPNPTVIPINVLDIEENFTYEQSIKSISEIITQALPEFDNSYSNIYLTFPYAVGTKSSAQLMEFSYLSQNSTKFNEINQYLKKNTSSNNIKFNYDVDTGTISENKAFGSTYIRNTLQSENDSAKLNNFIQDVLVALEDLVSQLPEKITDIKKYQSYDHHGATQDFLARPLLTLINKITSPEVLDFICQKYPQFKDYYNLQSDYYQQDEFSRHILSQRDCPLWVQQLNNFTHVEKNEYLYTYYKNGIIDSKDPLIEFQPYYLSIFKQALYKNDINFIKNELKNPENVQLLIVHNSDAPERTKKDIDDYPTRICNNIEILKLLKEYKFPFFIYYDDQTRTNNVLENSEIEQLFKSIINKDSSELELSKVGIISLFYNSYPQQFYSRLKNFCELFPDFTKTEIISVFAKKILQNIDGDDIPSLFKEFPSIDYSGIDVFSHLHKKYQVPVSTYALAVEAGADPRICSNFIENIVKARDDGLKLLKALNKEGIVVVKNPDYVFEIYNNKPTKNFTTYFDKCSDDIFSKYTANGNVVWWGVESQEQIKSKLYRINDVTQNSKDGRSVFHYFAHKEHTNAGQNSFENIVKVIFGSQFDAENQKFDLSYVYPNGNNLIHELLTFSTFKKSFNASSLNIIDRYAKVDLAQQFNQVNKEGLTPLEMMVRNYSLDNKMVFNMSFIITDIFKYFGNRINYAQLCNNGKPLIDTIAPFLGEKEKIAIEDMYMQQVVPINEEHHFKNNIKKF